MNDIIEKRVNELDKMCCGCGLCSAICPAQAIKMKRDSLGYIYPYIDKGRCIGCQKCTNLCILNKEHSFHSPIATYAGVRKDKQKLMLSSSGGVFAAVAEMILKQGGLVCGARIKDDFSVSHVIIDNINDLQPIVGSKYVQSNINELFRPLKNALAEGRIVLFSGTPCQVDAIRTYTENPNNLFTMEIVCHGVPNQVMFKSFLETIGEGKKLLSFQFRDKRQGWSFNHTVSFLDGSSKRINHRLSSYMTLFMKGCIYRESCYSCPYAGEKRNADVTIGDFWGVVRKRPDLVKKINIDKGVSCVIVSSEKGRDILSRSDISLYEVDYQDIIEGNGPLNHPSKKGEKQQDVLEIWGKRLMWKDVDDYWKRTFYKKRFKFWAVLPNSIRNRIRVMLKMR